MIDNLEALWTRPGRPVAVDIAGNKKIELGSGIVRYDRPDGSQKLSGLTAHGRQLSYESNGQTEWWHYETNSLAKQILSEAVTRVTGQQRPMKEGSFDFPAGKLSFRQFFPGAGGAQLSVLKFHDSRGPFQVISEQPLSEHELSNIARIMTEAPPATFHASRQIFVIDTLGETRRKGGEAKKIGGLADFNTGQIFVGRSQVADPDKCRYVLDHESGHVLDAKQGGGKKISETAVDENGKRIFGNPIFTTKSGGRDLINSGYVSDYATLNTHEDFAETHRFVLSMRRAFNEKNRGRDFFTLQPPELGQHMARRNINPFLRKKIQTIAKMYREMPQTAMEGKPS